MVAALGLTDGDAVTLARLVHEMRDALLRRWGRMRMRHVRHRTECIVHWPK
jgi:hypothetical protein